VGAQPNQSTDQIDLDRSNDIHPSMTAAPVDDVPTTCDETTSWDSAMPTDLLHHVISFATSACDQWQLACAMSRTCKAWAGVRVAWLHSVRAMRVDDDDDDENAPSFVQLKRALPTMHSLEHLSLNCRQYVIGDDVLSRVVGGIQLHHMRMGMMWCVSERTLAAFLRRCPRLATLEFGCGAALDDASISTIVEHCTCLTELSVRFGFRLTDVSALAIATHGTSLSSLCLQNSHGVTDAGVARVVDECRKLHTLDVGACHQLTRVGHQRSTYASLTLSYCWNVTDASIVAATHANLTKLDLSYCSLVSDASVAHLKVARSLRELNLKFCSRVTSVHALRRMPLTLLDLSSCYNVANADIANLECDALHTLRLVCNRGVTDQGLCALGTSSRALALVDLAYCSTLTDVGICAVANPSLRSVSLTYVSQLTDVVLATLAQRCPRLVELDVNFCKSVTDAGVATLVQGCTQLERLCIGCCFNVTDVSIYALATHCPSICVLDVSNCHRLTDGALRALADHSTKLAEVSLQHCDALTDGGVRCLVACGRLRALQLPAQIVHESTTNLLFRECARLTRITCANRTVLQR